LSLLEVEGLRVRLRTANGLVTVVDGVDYGVEQGEVFGVAGESGSGKTISMLALLGLLPDGAQVEGRVQFDGKELLGLPRSQLRSISGRDLAMVFQDPMTSLHPMLSVGRQLTEHVEYHLGLNRRAAEQRARELLEEVRIPDGGQAIHAYFPLIQPTQVFDRTCRRAGCRRGPACLLRGKHDLVRPARSD
jgi:oligopeptide transport system ATP-binding protein